MAERPRSPAEPQACRLVVNLPGDPLPGPETDAFPAEVGTLAVPPDLRPAIGQALVWRETRAPGQPIIEHVLPDGALRIWFDLSDAGAEPVILGPRLAPATVVLQGCLAGLSLALRPAAARSLLGGPVSEVRAQAVGLAAFWGPEARDLGERLAWAGSPGRLAETLWEGLRQRLRRAGWDAEGHATAGRLAAAVARGGRPETLGLGERRLQQLCAEHLGLAPREHRRLARWHDLLRRLRAVDRPDWAALALDHGWYDQAHMARDFRAFSGMTPKAYLALAVSGSSKTARGAPG